MSRRQSILRLSKISRPDLEWFAVADRSLMACFDECCLAHHAGSSMVTDPVPMIVRLTCPVDPCNLV